MYLVCRKVLKTEYAISSSLKFHTVLNSNGSQNPCQTMASTQLNVASENKLARGSREGSSPSTISSVTGLFPLLLETAIVQSRDIKVNCAMVNVSYTSIVGCISAVRNATVAKIKLNK